EVFNVVDDDLPSSRQFLRLYKQNVRRFISIYVPHVLSHALCCFWEKYSSWSEGQLPPVFNRRKWRALWKKTRYSNAKLKTRLGRRCSHHDATGKPCRYREALPGTRMPRLCGEARHTPRSRGSKTCGARQ